MLKYPHLFEPIRLEKTLFRNRMFASPVSGRALGTQNRPNADCIAFYEQKAMGGIASVCIGETSFYEAGTVIFSIRRLPLWEEADALRPCAPEFYIIGDCGVPKNIMQATAMADAAARNIGRLRR